MNAEEIKATIIQNRKRAKDELDLAISNCINTNISFFEHDLKTLLTGTTFQTKPKTLYYPKLINATTQEQHDLEAHIVATVEKHFESRGIKLKKELFHPKDGSGRYDCPCNPGSLGCVAHFFLSVE